MDKYNVIIPVRDIDELNNDMVAWSSLPYDFRMRSDEECIRQYGMTNRELYEKTRAEILANTYPEKTKEIGGTVSESSFEVLQSQYNFNVEETVFNEKLQYSHELQKSPNIIIIDPFRDFNHADYTIDDLNEKYNKFCMLTTKNKMYSNAYSLNIWGYNVYNMYNIMMKQILTIEAFSQDDEDIIIHHKTSTERNIEPVQELAFKRIMEDDKIGLLNIKLDSCANTNILSSVLYEELNQMIDKHVHHEDFVDSLSYIVPFLNLNESEYYGIHSEDIKDYYPGMEMSESAMKYARERQARWLDEHAVNIIDATKIKTRNKVVIESTQVMRNLYKTHNLEPVYIVLSYNRRLFTKMIKLAKGSDFTHAGLSLDSDLRDIVSFKPGNKLIGFNHEDLGKYLDIDKTSDLMVLAFFVNPETKVKIQNVIADFESKRSKTRYSFSNLFYMLVNKARPNDPNNLRLVCSQFVDTVLKLADLDMTNKSSNLVMPDDFKALIKNPKVFIVYNDKTANYSDKQVEDVLYSLFQNLSDDKIKYSSMIEEACNYVIESYYQDTADNKKANSVLSEIRELIKPESVDSCYRITERDSSIMEFNFPIKSNDKGDIEIKLYKSLEDEYQEAHRLLKDYGTNNIEGIKHELARLFYINTAIEKKVKKMQKGDPNYKKFIDLRARVLNDFRKYFKIVLEKEPDFDFAAYFQKSEYYNGNIIIDNSIVKFTGALIKKFIESLGI